MSTTRSFPSAARVRAAQRRHGSRRIDVKAVLGLERDGCLGNCRQGRDPCTLPGVCGAPRVRAPLDARPTCGATRDARPACGTPVPRTVERSTAVDWPDTEPLAPAPAEACTELGANFAVGDGDALAEGRRMEMLVAVLALACAIAALFAALHTA